MKIMLSISAKRLQGVPAGEYVRLLKARRSAYDRQASDAARAGDKDDAEDFRKESGTVAQLMDKINAAEAALAKAQSNLDELLDQAAEYVTPIR